MLQLFFVEDINSLELIGDNAHHAERVLRMKVEEHLLISDGKGAWAKCIIKKIDKKKVSLSLIESGHEEKSEIQIDVLQALTKNDRAKEAVELLTAAGVHKIIPWHSARSIGKESEKWESVAIEAAKQTRRFYIPKVHKRVSTSDAAKLFSEYEQILICHESALTAISDAVKPVKRTLIVIGPEGGLDDNELLEFQSAGGKVIKLGRPILRSAHAGIAAVSAASALMKVW